MAKKTQHGEARRAQIAQAFLHVLAKRGYDGASITEIAARAKLTPGLVHYHFKNKLEILVAAMRSLLAEHAALLERELTRAGPDPLAQLAAFLEVHLGLGRHANPTALACWLQLSAEALRQRQVRRELEAALRAISARLVEIVQRGRASGALTCDDPRAAAASIVALIQGYFSLAAAARPLLPSGSAAACATRMTEGLLGCDLPAPCPSARTPPARPPRGRA
ncbi:MAG: TetR/AcrR family transcriptional regulator [Kofleriaceae bacterium]